MDLFKMRYCLISIFLFYVIITALFYPAPKIKERENNGTLTLSFDDGYLSQYEIAFKQMEKYGYKGSLFLIANWTGFFEGKELMKFEQAKEMQDNGWEIGSHSLEHKRLTLLPEEELKKELLKSKEILEERGFEIKSIAFPFGDYNKMILEQAKNYYSASRAMVDGYNKIEALDFSNLKSKWVLKKHSSKEVCSWINKANNEGLWLILDFHNLGEEKTPWDFSEKKFKEVLKCIKKEGIRVKTIKEVLEDEKRN